MERGYTYYVQKQSDPRQYSLLPFIDEIESFGPLRYERIVDQGLRSPIDMTLLRKGVLLFLYQVCDQDTLIVSRDDVFSIVSASMTDHESGGYSEDEAALLLSLAKGILKVCKDAEDN